MSVNLQTFGMAAGFINRLIASGQYKPLTDAQIKYLVGKGSWIINAELRQAPLGREINPQVMTTAEWAAKQSEANPFVQELLAKPQILLIGTLNA